jgi:hypothetical protein
MYDVITQLFLSCLQQFTNCLLNRTNRLRMIYSHMSHHGNYVFTDVQPSLGLPRHLITRILFVEEHDACQIKYQIPRASLRFNACQQSSLFVDSIAYIRKKALNGVEIALPCIQLEKRVCIVVLRVYEPRMKAYQR